MSRSTKIMLADVDVIEDAARRMAEVLYAKLFFKKRYTDALGRLTADLGDQVAVIVTLAGDDPKDVASLLRIQLNNNLDGNLSRDVPLTLPADLAQQ